MFAKIQKLYDAETKVKSRKKNKNLLRENKIN